MAIISKMKGFAIKHKIISIIMLAAAAYAGYFFYQRSNSGGQDVQYITATAEAGSLVESISGSGQVSAESQLDLKTKASGSVIRVIAKKGQEVKKGELLLQINASDALKSVRDAETNLETAKLSMEKLVAPADDLSVLQSENSLNQAKETKQQDLNSLVKSYEDGLNSIVSAFLDLPDIISGVDQTLYGYEISESEVSVQNTNNKSALLISTQRNVGNYYNDLERNIKQAENNYASARTAYNLNFSHYSLTNRGASNDDINSLLEESVNTLYLLSDSIKSDLNMYNFWMDYRQRMNLRIFSQVSQYISDLNSYSSKVNSHLSSLLSAKSSIESAKNKIINDDRDIEVKQELYEQLIAGADSLDLRTQQISIQQKENALADAKEKLADYSLRAPIDGMIAEFTAKTGEDVSSGASIGSIISSRQIAEIALNEIDASKVKVGQKATLSFDALPDLSLTGTVVDLDTLGTVSQGVVSYNVKIALDVQDEKIKPGMSVTVNIILNSMQNVLLVPLTAVKTQGSSSYVEMLINGKPERRSVKTGSANDTQIEITSGLNEGDLIISQSINTSAVQSTSAASNSNRPAGGGGAFGAFQLGR